MYNYTGIVKTEKTMKQWIIVFLVVIGILIISLAVGLGAGFGNGFQKFHKIYIRRTSILIRF